MAIILSLAFLVTGCKAQDMYPTEKYTPESVNAEIEPFTGKYEQETASNSNTNIVEHMDFCTVSSYGGSPYAVINGNTPLFLQKEYTTVSFEHYSELDSLGRCGVAYACI